MKRTYQLIVEISGHPAEHPYLVTLPDEERGVIMEHRASNLQVCMTAVTERLMMQGRKK